VQAEVQEEALAEESETLDVASSMEAAVEAAAVATAAAGKKSQKSACY